MKSKLLLIIFLTSGICYGQSVPNTTNFTLQDVQTVVGYNNLDDCFTNSNAAYFDATYGSKTMSPKTLYGFRNYTIPSVSVPTLATTAITSIMDISATSGGNTLTNGGGTIDAKGVVWSTSTAPTFASHAGGGITSDGTGTADFASSLTSLTCPVTYYVRAYAHNSAGYGYGNELTFTSGVTLASVASLYNQINDGTCGTGSFTTTFASALSAISNINTTTCGITTTSGENVRGVAFSAGNIMYHFSGGCNFNGTGYYISNGTTGSNQIVQMTSGTITAITAIAQASFSGITSAYTILPTGFKTDVTVSSQGYDAITEKGIVLMLGSGTPTISNIKINTGTGSANYTTTVTGLTPNKTYYYRAYAINSAGVGYGGSVLSMSTSATQTITSTQSWICPTGVSTVTVECLGGGGSGGAATGNPARAGGGAGGAYVKSTGLAVTSGNSYTITIGAGGVATTTVGVVGGDTWFNTSGTILAKGGAYGVTSTSTSSAGGTGSTTSCVGTTKWAGGSGGAGVASGTSGGGGSGAGSTAAGNNGSTGTAGVAKASYGGAGGNGVTVINSYNTGSTYGGGGSGGVATSATDGKGGNGGNGLVILSFP